MHTELNASKKQKWGGLGLVALVGVAAWAFLGRGGLPGGGGNDGGGDGGAGESIPSAGITNVTVSQVVRSGWFGQRGPGALMGNHQVPKAKDAAVQVATSFQTASTGSYQYRVKSEVIRDGQVLDTSYSTSSGEINPGQTRTLTSNFVMFLGALAFVPSGSVLDVRATLQGYIPFQGWTDLDQSTHAAAVRVL